MATQTKKSVSRAVVGNTKKSKSSKGLSHKAIIFGLVAVVAFSVAAAIGWEQWQDNRVKAKAATLTIAKSHNATLGVCKYYQGGNRVQIRAIVSTNGNSVNKNVEGMVKINGVGGGYGIISRMSGRTIYGPTLPVGATSYSVVATGNLVKSGSFTVLSTPYC